MDDRFEVESLIPCRWVYPFNTVDGIDQDYSCIGVFKAFYVFEVPSLPRNFNVLTIINALEGSYNLSMALVDVNGIEILKTDSAKVDHPREGYIVVIFAFNKVIFQNEGEYILKLIVDNEIIQTCSFGVLKLRRSEYSSKDVDCLLRDPETIKNTTIELACECGNIKQFEFALDPEKRITEELLPPAGNIHVCEKCGNETNISEAIANAKFYLGSKNIIDTFNRNLTESKKLGSAGFLNAALIMQVTAFEAMMRDHFVLNYKYWFIHLIDDRLDFDSNINVIKKDIIKTTKDMKLKEEFHDGIFLLGKRDYETQLEEIDDYNNVLKKTIFGDDEGSSKSIKMISFQQLNGDLGCFWAYKRFFGIDLKGILDREGDKGNKYSKQILDNFLIRHRIVHGSPGVNINQNEISPELLKQNEIIITFIRTYLLSELEKTRAKKNGIDKVC
jgi:hypothetical protein